MKLMGKFALGLRFAPRPEPDFAAFAFGQVFSLLGAGCLAGMALYGGAEQAAQAEGYLAVIVHESLNALRCVHQTLAADPALMALLERELPFIENNRIRLTGPWVYYGVVREDGSLDGGDALLGARPA